MLFVVFVGGSLYIYIHTYICQLYLSLNHCFMVILHTQLFLHKFCICLPLLFLFFKMSMCRWVLILLPSLLYVFFFFSPPQESWRQNFNSSINLSIIASGEGRQEWWRYSPHPQKQTKLVGVPWQRKTLSNFTLSNNHKTKQNKKNNQTKNYSNDTHS